MLPIERGATYTFTITHKHNNVPTSLQGGTVTFMVKKKQDDDVTDAAAYIKVNAVLANQSISPGVAVITCTPTQTLMKADNSGIIPTGKWYYAIKVKHGDADNTQLVEGEGKITISGSAINEVL